MPKVSVIVPNYNHAPFLSARLESVYNQTYQDFEVILLDDASTDKSVSILKTYSDRPNTRLVINQENSGSPFKQWNKGVRLAVGDLVWIAESDDVADVRFLERLITKYEKHPECGLLFCRSHIIDERGLVVRLADVDMTDAQSRREWIMAGRKFINKHMLTLSSIINASSVVFARELFIAAGCAPEEWKYCGDLILWCRLCALTHVCYIPDPLNQFRLHEGGLSRKKGMHDLRMRELYSSRSMLFEEFQVNWFRRQRSLNKVFSYLAVGSNLGWSDDPIKNLPEQIKRADSLLVLRILLHRILVRFRYRMAKIRLYAI